MCGFCFCMWNPGSHLSHLGDIDVEDEMRDGG